MNLSRRNFLELAGVGVAGGVVTLSEKPRKLVKDTLTELLDFFSNPELSQYTYTDVLPPDIIKTIDDTVRTFGFAELLAKPENFGKEIDGVHFIKPERARNYDCLSAARDISNIIQQHKNEIPGYVEHSISVGVDEKGLNPLGHYWVSLVVRRDGKRHLVNIDLTQPYKGRNPRHVEEGVVKNLSYDRSINLNGVMITSGYWQETKFTYTSAVGIKDGKFIVYRLNAIPKNPSENVIVHEVTIDPKGRTTEAKYFELEKNDKEYPTPVAGFRLKSPKVVSLIPESEFAALNNISKVYFGRDLHYLRGNKKTL